MKKIYYVYFERRIKAYTQVEADTPKEAEKCFDKGEWIDHYETIEILDQEVKSIKEVE